MKSKMLVGKTQDGRFTVRSSGFLIFRKTPSPILSSPSPILSSPHPLHQHQFLLLKHNDRYDLPKGHVEEGESDLDTAFRELLEETGIPRDQVKMVEGFTYQDVYYPRYKRFNNEVVKKTLIVFMGFVNFGYVGDVTVSDEHEGFCWMEWNPDQRVQKNTIDPLLEACNQFFKSKEG